MQIKKAVIGAVTVVTLIASVAGTAALAKEDGTKDAKIEKGDNGLHLGEFKHLFKLKGLFVGLHERHGDVDNDRDNDRDDRQATTTPSVVNHTLTIVGRVTAVSGAQITAVSPFANTSTTFAVNTDASTTFTGADNASSTLGSIAVGDIILARGTVTAQSGTMITLSATRVRDFGNLAFPFRADVTGTVTGLNAASGTLTLQTAGNQTITVISTTSTVITANGTSTTFGSIVLGASVRVKGIWNAMHDAITALVIRIL